MSELNRYTYTWDVNNSTLVFDFRIQSGHVPDRMSLCVFSKSDPGNKLFKESVNGEIILDAHINGQRLKGCVWLDNSGADHGYVEARLDYGRVPSDLQFEGAMVKYFYDYKKPVIPVIPDQPDFPTDRLTTVNQEFSPLFPYISIKGWPSLISAEENLHFVNYPGPPIPEQGSFFYLLLQQTTRMEMEQAAVTWIESSSFISSPERLEGQPVSQFYRLDKIIERKTTYDPSEVMKWIAFELKINIDELLLYINSTAYAQARDDFWQSWFAMVLLNGGYRPEVFTMLTRTIVFCHFLETIAGAYSSSVRDSKTMDDAIEAVSSGKADQSIVLQHAAPGSKTIEQLLDASILLQSPPFPIPIPLPPYSKPVRSSGQSWVEPYAVGHLEMVRKKRIGYQSGDLAHIENVMRGERRETKKRKLSRIEEIAITKESDERFQENNNSETKANFEYQAQKAAAESFTQFTYDKLSSTYGGPTTFTLDGSYEIVNGNATPEQAASSGFGEYIITKTIQRLRHSIEKTRQRIQTDETEESTESIFDNRAGDENIRGVYRWLNEVYEARVVQYGSRLLVEFLINDPAEKFIHECKRLYGIDLEHPKTLGDFGINSYNDISFSAPAVHLTRALQYFGVYEWPPEPAPAKIVSMVLAAGNQLNVPLPDGYAASTAVITLPLNSSGTEPGSVVIPPMNGIIGQSAFDNTNIVSNTTSIADTSSLEVPMHGETGSIAAVLFDLLSPQQAAITDLPVIPPSSASSAGKNTVAGSSAAPVVQPIVQNAVSVSVNCSPTSELITAWQLKLFQLLMEGSEKREKSYYDKINTRKINGEQWLPPDLTALERRVLRNGCIEQLFVVFGTLTGPPPEDHMHTPPGMFTIYEPVINDFFNNAFEWKELSWSLTARTENAVVHSDRFSNPEMLPPNTLSAFLQADQSRVLVPVTPAMSLAVLYFLSTGTVWQGPPEEVPVTAQTIQAAFAVKVEKMEVRQYRESGSWTFEVPTSLLVLDAANELCLKNGSGEIAFHKNKTI